MQIAKLLTSNKYSRLVFVVYAAALHILVFVALFELMSISAPTNQHSFTMNKPDSWCLMKESVNPFAQKHMSAIVTDGVSKLAIDAKTSPAIPPATGNQLLVNNNGF